MLARNEVRWNGCAQVTVETTAWDGLAHATKRRCENGIRRVLAAAGRQPFTKITTVTITAGRDRGARRVNKRRSRW